MHSDLQKKVRIVVVVFNTQVIMETGKALPIDFGLSYLDLARNVDVMRH